MLDHQQKSSTKQLHHNNQNNQSKPTNTPVTPTVHDTFPSITNNNGGDQMNLSNNNQDDVQTNLPLTPTGKSNFFSSVNFPILCCINKRVATGAAIFFL